MPSSRLGHRYRGACIFNDFEFTKARHPPPASCFLRPRLPGLGSRPVGAARRSSKSGGPSGRPSVSAACNAVSGAGYCSRPRFNSACRVFQALAAFFRNSPARLPTRRGQRARPLPGCDPCRYRAFFFAGSGEAVRVAALQRGRSMRIRYHVAVNLLLDQQQLWGLTFCNSNPLGPSMRKSTKEGNTC